MKSKSLIFLTSLIALIFCNTKMNAQSKEPVVRMAKIVVAPEHLDAYKKLLKEEIETSIRIEPGVLTLYAVSENNKPAHITIFETYSDTEAYQAHLKRPHFLK
jgi:quinol monooxygenase YgiN